MINVYKILPITNVEGPGTRFCIWVQGCKKHCKNCYATATWEFGCGVDFEVSELFKMITKEIDSIEGVTFLGGEPFEQASELAQLAKLIKSQNLSVLCFTGYTYEELLEKKDSGTEELLSNIDLLIDGGFEEENFDLNRPWVGSSNQRYIFLSNRYSEEEILKYKNKIETRIDKNGKLTINGMGNFKEYEKMFIYN